MFEPESDWTAVCGHAPTIWRQFDVEVEIFLHKFPNIDNRHYNSM